MYENEYISMYIPMYVGIGKNTPHIVDFATISLTILGVHVPHGEGGGMELCYRAWYRVE